MNKISKIALLICLLVINILLWFVFLPKEEVYIESNLYKTQLKNMDMYFIHHYSIKNSYIGANNLFKINKNKYFLDIETDSYCIVDLDARLCIDSFNHIVRKTDKCINRKCQL